MSENKTITYDQFKAALEEKLRLDKYVEHLTSITRAYIYQEEAERVKARKIQSAIDERIQNKS